VWGEVAERTGSEQRSGNARAEEAAVGARPDARREAEEREVRWDATRGQDLRGQR
jgi:hypothetical protein